MRPITAKGRVPFNSHSARAGWSGRGEKKARPGWHQVRAVWASVQRGVVSCSSYNLRPTLARAKCRQLVAVVVVLVDLVELVELVVVREGAGRRSTAPPQAQRAGAAKPPPIDLNHRTIM